MHALAIKLETILPDYKTLQFRVEELTEQLDEQQQALQHQQQEREILRRNSTQTTQQIELLEKDISFLQSQYQQINVQMEQAKSLLTLFNWSYQILSQSFSNNLLKLKSCKRTGMNGSLNSIVCRKNSRL